MTAATSAVRRREWRTTMLLRRSATLLSFLATSTFALALSACAAPTDSSSSATENALGGESTSSPDETGTADAQHRPPPPLLADLVESTSAGSSDARHALVPFAPPA